MKAFWAVLVILAAAVGIFSTVSDAELAPMNVCLALLGFGIAFYLVGGAPKAWR